MSDRGAARIALVTGGVSGIGAASVERLRQDVDEVLTTDIDPAGDVVVDLSDPGRTAAALAHVGRVDILVHSAGIVGPNKPLWEVSDEEWGAPSRSTSPEPSRCVAPSCPG